MPALLFPCSLLRDLHGGGSNVTSYSVSTILPADCSFIDIKLAHQPLAEHNNKGFSTNLQVTLSFFQACGDQGQVEVGSWKQRWNLPPKICFRTVVVGSFIILLNIMLMVRIVYYRILPLNNFEIKLLNFPPLLS